MPGSRKAERRLAARRKNEVFWNGKLTQFQFGYVPNVNGKSEMWHKPGSQNRKK